MSVSTIERVGRAERYWPSSIAARDGRFRVAVLKRSEAERLAHWRTAFSAQRKDSRYFEIVEDTMHPEITHRYVVVVDHAGRTVAIQPIFFTGLDLTEGLSDASKAPIRHIRRGWPSFLKARVLMVGAVSGEGHLDGGVEEQADYVPLLKDLLLREAVRSRASMIIFKEFPAQYRSLLGTLAQSGFIRLPSLPMTRLRLAFRSFDQYMQERLSHSTRKNLRRKFRAAEAAGAIEMTVRTDVEDIVDEIYPLYLQTYNRSRMRFEQLTRDFFVALGRRMSDKVRFFIWRQNGKAVAFNLCMVQGDTLYDEYVGIDYQSAASPHLYHTTYRDVIAWAIANGLSNYVSAGLCYDPKRHLRQELVPLDLYVRHTSPVVNLMMRPFLRWLDPVRHDEALKLFPNYAECRLDGG